MSDLTPQQRRQQRTHEAILTAARELIAEKGADKLSLRAIARRIDYSPAGLYEYFDGKEAIINALCERGEKQLTAYLSRVSSDLPLTERITHMLHQYVAFARDNPEFFTLMFTTMSIGEEAPDEGGYYEGSYGLLYGVIEEGIASGEIKTRPGYETFEIAYSLWSMGHGMAVLQTTYLRNFSFDFVAANQHTIEVFLAGLTQA